MLGVLPAHGFPSASCSVLKINVKSPSQVQPVCFTCNSSGCCFDGCRLCGSSSQCTYAAGADHEGSLNREIWCVWCFRRVRRVNARPRAAGRAHLELWVGQHGQEVLSPGSGQWPRAGQSRQIPGSCRGEDVGAREEPWGQILLPCEMPPGKYGQGGGCVIIIVSPVA